MITPTPSLSFTERLIEYGDYVPVVSAVPNLFYLFQKCVWACKTPSETTVKSHYYKWINERSYTRCFALILLPIIGNAFVAYYDYTSPRTPDPTPSSSDTGASTTTSAGSAPSSTVPKKSTTASPKKLVSATGASATTATTASSTAAHVKPAAVVLPPIPPAATSSDTATVSSSSHSTRRKGDTPTASPRGSLGKTSLNPTKSPRGSLGKGSGVHVPYLIHHFSTPGTPTHTPRAGSIGRSHGKWLKPKENDLKLSLTPVMEYLEAYAQRDDLDFNFKGILDLLKSEKEENHTIAIKTLEESNHILAKFILGLCFIQGVGAPYNPPHGFVYLLLHADRCHQHPEIWYELGVCYAIGIGVSVNENNEEIAFRLFESASYGHFRKAILALSECYTRGIGVTESSRHAAHWSRTAHIRRTPARTPLPKRIEFGQPFSVSTAAADADKSGED